MKLFNNRKGVTINFSTEGIIRAVILIMLAILAFRFIGNISSQLELIGISVFLALALNPAVSWLSRRLHLKRRVWATGLAYVVVLSLLVGFIVLVVPPFVKQTQSFVTTIPSTLESLKSGSNPAGRVVQRYSLEDEIDNFTHDLTGRVSDAPQYVLSTASRVGNILISILTVFVLTFMMLVEGPLWLKRWAAILPDDKREPYKKLARDMYGVITGYVNGQVLIAAIATFFAMIALLIATQILDVSINIVAAGAIVFLLGLIPLVGNTLAAILVVIICLFTSVPLAIIMAIYFPVYQQLENITLQPHIQARTNQLTPLVVFAAAIIGAGFGGLLGAFVAIPVAGCLRILLEYHFGTKLVPTEEKVAKA